MNYHPKHKSNSRTAVWIGAGVLAAVAIGALIFIIVTLPRQRKKPAPKPESFMIRLQLRAAGITFRRRKSKRG